VGGSGRLPVCRTTEGDVEHVRHNTDMPTPHPPQLLIPDYVGPVVAAAVFVVLMGFVKEPARRTLNALIVAGASGAYLSGGGFVVGEIAYAVVVMPFAYAGLG